MEDSFADAGFFASRLPGASKIDYFPVTFLVWENIGNEFLLFFSGFVLLFKYLDRFTPIRSAKSSWVPNLRTIMDFNALFILPPPSVF